MLLTKKFSHPKNLVVDIAGVGIRALQNQRKISKCIFGPKA